MLQGKTAFVIACLRLTAVNAVLVVVMVDERIVEQCSHSELFNQDRVYYRQYRMGFEN